MEQDWRVKGVHQVVVDAGYLDSLRACFQGKVFVLAALVALALVDLVGYAGLHCSQAPRR